MKLRFFCYVFLLASSQTRSAQRPRCGKSIQNSHRIPFPGVFLHALLRRPGKRLL
jgi:hypothetical protein